MIIVCVFSGCSGSTAKTSKKEVTVDVDLTQLSSTMVYSEVYNMLTTPEEYIGKTVKVKGTFNVYEDDSTGNVYYACLISDATACCQQGMEFIPEGDFKYPDDFPAVGDDVTVVGQFETYKEGDLQYVHLVDSEFISA